MAVKWVRLIGMENIGITPPEAMTFTPGTNTTDYPKSTFAVLVMPGDRISIDGVEAIVTRVSVTPPTIATRPVTDAD